MRALTANTALAIEVDGGVAHDTVARVVEAGADMLVAGSAIFAPGNTAQTEQNAHSFLSLARSAAQSDAEKSGAAKSTERS